MSFMPRFFPDDDAVRHVGEGLLGRTLPRPEWTHEAHIAAIAYFIIERPDIDLDADIRAIIAGYNASVGGVNDDTSGYHDTITRCFLTGIRARLAYNGASSLVERVNALLISPEGERDWPLRFYSRELLFSVEARRGYVPPDLKVIEPTATRQHWVDAASAMAENPYALITCPECTEGLLRSHDLKIEGKPELIRRVFRCDLCAAESALSLRAKTA